MHSIIWEKGNFNIMNKIKLVVLDVDGTLTDGKIYYDSLGNETKAFDVKDGMAIAQAIAHGIDIAIVTGRTSTIVDKRAKELGVKHIHQGIHDKVSVVDGIVKELNITYEDVMYIGDDINDLKIMKKVGWPACPKDAVEDVVKVCATCSKHKGGCGAVREIIESLLKAKGLWKDIIDDYIGANQ